MRIQYTPYVTTEPALGFCPECLANLDMARDGKLAKCRQCNRFIKLRTEQNDETDNRRP